MNIVQLNRIVKQVANCVELVHSYSDSSPYEYWNTENVKYGSICFCIKKTRMRSNTTEYTALMYYGDRLLQDGSNKNEVWSNANDVLQNIIGTLNYTSDGSISVAYPYDITHFEQKFADNLAGAYAQIVITVTGIGECGNLLYGYEGSQEEIKLESIVKTITVNGEYDIVPSKEYDAISDVKVVVNVAPDPMDTFASIGYNEENAGGFLQQFNTDLDVAKMILDNWNNTGSSSVNMEQWKNIVTYYPAVDLTMKPTNMNFRFYSWPKLQSVPALDFTGRSSMQETFNYCSLISFIGPITTSGSMTNMEMVFANCSILKELDLTHMDTSNVTTMYSMFYNCRDLNMVKGLEDFDVSNVTTIYGMFQGCDSLTRLDLSKWNPKNLTTMYQCFWDMQKLNYLDISSWDLANITNGGNFIGGYGTMSNLTDVKFGKNWKLNLTTNMFNRCPNLTVESLLSIINGLYDFTGNGETPSSNQGTCQFGTTNLNKLTDEQKAVATNKGWTLT